MPKITYMPTEEIVLHQVIEYDNKAFFEEVMRQNMTQQLSMIPPVNWIDGIAFSVWRFPDSDDVVREAMNGKMHFFSVSFTRIPHQSHFQITLANQEIRVPLRKADNNPNFASLVAYLKEYKQSSSSETGVSTK